MTLGLITSAYSSDGSYFAQSSPDGIIKIWETESNRVKQEYTPSAHLSATCTCLSWSPRSRLSHSVHSDEKNNFNFVSKNSDQSSDQLNTRKKKKRRKSSESCHEVESFHVQFIAIGTNSGAILIYNVSTSELQASMFNGHSQKVNAVCWHANFEKLYSCSKDCYIIEWSTKSYSVTRKWRADKQATYSLYFCLKENLLFSASRSIKLWNIDDQSDNLESLEVIKGHTSEVFYLNYAPGYSEVSSYLISAAIGERIVCLWKLHSKKGAKRPIATFQLDEEPIYCDVRVPNAQSEPFLLAVITKSGVLLIFDYVLNGHGREPIKPKFRVHVSTEGNKVCTPKIIPAISCHIDDLSNISFAHGNFLQVTFEKVHSSKREDICLIRSDPSYQLISEESNVSKVNTPNIPSKVVILTPNPTHNKSTSGAKRKNVQEEFSMEERLNAIGIGQQKSESSTTKSIPQTNSLSTLLAQGLHSGDSTLLNEAFKQTALKTTETSQIIKHTLEKLPTALLQPLIRELSIRICGSASPGSQAALIWVKHFLEIHTSSLLTFTDFSESLVNLHQILENRVSVFGKLTKLQGKLELTLSQLSTQTQEQITGQTPLVRYEDNDYSSSDDEFLMDDIIQDVSSESNWEDELNESSEDKSSEAESAMDTDEPQSPTAHIQEISLLSDSE